MVKHCKNTKKKARDLCSTPGFFHLLDDIIYGSSSQYDLGFCLDVINKPAAKIQTIFCIVWYNCNTRNTVMHTSNSNMLFLIHSKATIALVLFRLISISSQKNSCVVDTKNRVA